MDPRTQHSPTQARQMAQFAARASYDALSAAAREQIKIRVLDALACALGALEADPIKKHNAEVHAQTAIEAMIELRARGRVTPRDVDRIDVETFGVAHRIIGSSPAAVRT